MSTPSPFVEAIISSADHYADHGIASTFVSNVPVETVAHDGNLDDPEWVKMIAGEVADGVEGVDWVWDYSTRIGPRQYGKLKRVGLPVTAECPGTHESAFKMLMERRFLRSGQSLLEDRWGGRVLWNNVPDGPFVSGPGPASLNL